MHFHAGYPNCSAIFWHAADRNRTFQAMNARFRHRIKNLRKSARICVNGPASVRMILLQIPDCPPEFSCMFRQLSAGTFGLFQAVLPNLLPSWELSTIRKPGTHPVSIPAPIPLLSPPSASPSSPHIHFTKLRTVQTFSLPMHAVQTLAQPMHTRHVLQRNCARCMSLHGLAHKANVLQRHGTEIRTQASARHSVRIIASPGGICTDRI